MYADRNVREYELYRRVPAHDAVILGRVLLAAHLILQLQFIFIVLNTF
jgi:hypothetical protein